jgi:hypothetical protein
MIRVLVAAEKSTRNAVEGFNDTQLPNGGAPRGVNRLTTAALIPSKPRNPFNEKSVKLLESLDGAVEQPARQWLPIRTLGLRLTAQNIHHLPCRVEFISPSKSSNRSPRQKALINPLVCLAKRKDVLESVEHFFPICVLRNEAPKKGLKDIQQMVADRSVMPFVARQGATDTRVDHCRSLRMLPIPGRAANSGRGT